MLARTFYRVLDESRDSSTKTRVLSTAAVAIGIAMSNVRSIRDLESNPRQAVQPQRATGSWYARQADEESQSSIYGYEDSGDGSPLPTVGSVLFPNFKASPQSFIFVVTIIQILMFAATLIVAKVKFGAAFVESNSMLGPGTDAFLYMGAKYTPDIQDGEIWRLFVPIFLHGGFIHLFFNLFFQCNMGFRIEAIWGVPRMVFIYLCSGIGGNLMSAICNVDSVSVGASGALFGILGGQLSFLYMNWVDIPNATSVTFNIVLVIVINFLFGFSGVVDNYAHLGGLISGILLGLAHPKKISEFWTEKERFMCNAGICLSILFYVITIVVLFAVV